MIDGNFQVLVIDDDAHVREFVSGVLRADGWNVVQSSSVEDALERVKEGFWFVVFCDVMLGSANDYSMLRYLKEKMPQAKVVLMTNQDTAAGAAGASALGVCDYLLNPLGSEELQSVSRALREQLTERLQRSSPTRRVAAYHSDIELVRRSQAFIQIMKQVDHISNTDAPVLLIGESEIGKELAASAIHCRSQRSERPFLAVNCSTIPAESLEAELFGRHRDTRGLWEEADGGTIFLDEITETNSSFQVTLLRTLESGEIRKVGSNEPQRVDVRLIAASNRNVEQDVAAGRFRNDLFSRLNAVSIVLPSLAEESDALSPREPGKGGWVTLSEIEARYVARVLEHTRGNKQAAARVLAVDRKTLDRMIKRHNIVSPSRRSERLKASNGL